MSNAAQHVANIEHDLDVLDRKNIALENELAATKYDRDSLRLQLAQVKRERDEFMITATKMQTIMETTSLGLVQGLKTMTEEQQQRRHAARQNQADIIAGEHTSTPLFLRRADRRAEEDYPDDDTAHDDGGREGAEQQFDEGDQHPRAPLQSASALPPPDYRPPAHRGEDRRDLGEESFRTHPTDQPHKHDERLPRNHVPGTEADRTDALRRVAQEIGGNARPRPRDLDQQS